MSEQQDQRRGAALFDFVGQAFAAISSLPAKTSKHRPFADADTGPDAATKYGLRHPRGLRQLQRRLRIEAGKRPLKFDVPGKREWRCKEKWLRRKGSSSIKRRH
jgi:hypothetical protein